jgi:hypothetical protein
MNSACDRVCVYGPRVGVVGLCPCIDMTFWDRLQIVKKLSSDEPGDYKLSSSIEKLVEFDRSVSYHHCSYMDDLLTRDTKLQISFKMTLDQEGSLVVETEWEVSGSNVQFRTRRNCWLCPHLKFEIKVLSLRESYGYCLRDGIPESHNHSCKYCRTSYIKAEWDSSWDPESYFEITSRRRFGKDTNEADEEWCQQTETAFENLPDDSRIRRDCAILEWQLSPDYAR